MNIQREQLGYNGMLIWCCLVTTDIKIDIELHVELATSNEIPILCRCLSMSAMVVISNYSSPVLEKFCTTKHAVTIIPAVESSRSFDY